MAKQNDPDLMIVQKRNRKNRKTQEKTKIFNDGMDSLDLEVFRYIYYSNEFDDHNFTILSKYTFNSNTSVNICKL